MTLDRLLDLVGWSGVAAMLLAGLIAVARIARRRPRTPLAEIVFAIGLVLIGTANLYHAAQDQDRTVAEIQTMMEQAKAPGPAATVGERAGAAVVQGLIERDLKSLRFGGENSVDFMVALGSAWGLTVLGLLVVRRERKLRPQPMGATR